MAQRFAVEVRNDIPKLTKGMEERIERVVKRAAFAMEAHIKASMTSDPKTGREYQSRKLRRRGYGLRGKRGSGRVVYQRAKLGVMHRASAPGESPAVDTGLLVNSIAARRLGRWAWRVSASTQYAVKLELGAGRVRPRPYMRPAAAWIRPRFEQWLRKAIEPRKAASA